MVFVLGHKKLLKATIMKQINTSSSDKSSFLINLSAKKDTGGILDFPNFDKIKSLPTLGSEGKGLVPIGDQEPDEQILQSMRLPFHHELYHQTWNPPNLQPT